MTVIEVSFRKGGGYRAPLDSVFADNGGRGSLPFSAALTTSPPSDTEETHAFHASHGLGESFISGDGLDMARGIFMWVGIMFAAEFACCALGWWLAT